MSDKKKIVFVHIALWTGGIETALVNFLNHIDYDRFDVSCLILSNHTQIMDRITPKCKLIIADRGKAVSFSAVYPKLFQKLHDLMQIYASSSFLRKAVARFMSVFKSFEAKAYYQYIRNNLDSETYDAVIAYSNKAGEAAVRIFDAEKYVLFYHYSEMRRTYHDEIAYRKSDIVYAVSAGNAAKLKAFVPRYASKIKVFPNLTNAELVRSLADEGAETEIRKTGLRIMSCGRLVRDKGFDIAAQACRILVDQGWNDLTWYIIGDGQEKEALRQLIDELGLQEHFVLLGLKKNPYPYIQECDIFVQSSRIESFGLTITEAAILGKPIVSTKTDGASELLKDGINAILCDTDAESMAASVRELLVNVQEAERYKNYWRAFSFEQQNTQILESFYTDLFGNEA